MFVIFPSPQLGENKLPEIWRKWCCASWLRLRLDQNYARPMFYDRLCLKCCTCKLRLGITVLKTHVFVTTPDCFEICKCRRRPSFVFVLPPRINGFPHHLSTTAITIWYRFKIKYLCLRFTRPHDMFHKKKSTLVKFVKKRLS